MVTIAVTICDVLVSFLARGPSLDTLNLHNNTGCKLVSIQKNWLPIQNLKNAIPWKYLETKYQKFKSAMNPLEIFGEKISKFEKCT